MTKKDANACVSFVEMHKEGCLWKTRQRDDSVDRVPLQSPSVTARDLRTTAVALDPIVFKNTIQHPLAPPQLSSLRVAGSTVGVSTLPSGDPSTMQVDESTTPTSELSDTSSIVALFGWQPVTSPSSHDCRPIMSISESRSGSLAASTLMPPSPTLSRGSSVLRSFTGRGRMLTPTLGPSASPRSAPCSPASCE
ncbi:hypothetical protein EV401DRAFT_186544 [Pisolithus croceorrhizus]|nr:hypothetical protein EV401DRAFT_186544 [Pisolithus croceorrhizus]